MKLIIIFLIFINFLIFSGCKAIPKWSGKNVHTAIILDFLPQKADCEIVKAFEVKTFASKLAPAIKFGRNEARIKTVNLGGNYLTFTSSKIVHQKHPDDVKKDRIEFTLYGNAYNCNEKVRRLYRNLNEIKKIDSNKVIVLDKHSPVIEYCQFVGNFYLNDTPKKLVPQTSLKKLIQTQIKLKTSKMGGNIMKPNLIQFSTNTGEHVIYGKVYNCTERYLDFLKTLGYK